MNSRLTRSTTDLSNIKIENLQYNKPSKSRTSKNMSEVKISKELSHNETQFIEQKSDEEVKEVSGHELNDQFINSQSIHRNPIKEELQKFEKFTGLGDAEQWLTSLLMKFDSLQVDMDDRITFVPVVLTGEAFIWYIQHEKHMLTFISFAKLFLQRFFSTKLEDEKPTSTNHMLIHQQLILKDETQEDVFSSLRNQLLLGHIEKLPKFSGRLKQNVSKWLREVNQTMHLLKLSDKEKLFFIPSCLETDAKDWFFDNYHLFSSWSLFVQKLIDTFESSSKADIAFNRLRQYQQGLNQDVRQYYFEIMKLCKEANPTMDEATKLQYLKDGLKTSLRFEILLKNPKTTEVFLEYAQRIEELKSLDDKQVIRSSVIDDKFNSYSMNSQQPSNYDSSDYKQHYSTNNLYQPMDNTTTNKNQFTKNKPRPPYRCYRCGSTEHYIQDCQNFQ
jgi:hypothetical protein